MTSNSKPQKAYNKCKCAIIEHQEIEQCLIDMPFSLLTTDKE